MCWSSTKLINDQMKKQADDPYEIVRARAIYGELSYGEPLTRQNASAKSTGLTG